MRATAIPLFVAYALASGIALAQGVKAPPRAASATNNWVVSETISPVDYTPVVVAVTPSRESGESGESSTMRLSIHCRNGRTELAVAGAAISGRGDDYAISYRIDSDGPVQIAAGAPLFGTGVAFKGDIVRLLQSLPEEGNMVIRLTPRTGAIREGNFPLGGLKLVRNKLAGACKWPQAVAKPRD
jgi:hypothetical protein